MERQGLTTLEMLASLHSIQVLTQPHPAHPAQFHKKCRFLFIHIEIENFLSHALLQAEIELKKDQWVRKEALGKID